MLYGRVRFSACRETAASPALDEERRGRPDIVSVMRLPRRRRSRRSVRRLTAEFLFALTTALRLARLLVRHWRSV